MKKVLVATLATMTFCGAASQALALTSADFYNSLTRVVYNPDQKELAADLGDFDTLAIDTNLASGGFSLADFNTGTTWADIDLAYIAYNSYKTGPTPVSPTNLDIWFASTNDSLTLPEVNLGQTSVFGAATVSVYSQMGVHGTIGGTAEINPNDANSFTQSFGTNGNLISIISDQSGQQNLASFDAAGLQSVDMYLYHLSKEGSAAWFMDSSATTSYKYVITTFEDGGYSVVSEPAAVPVPGAVWLLGSGLAGIVGMRRKNS